MQHQTNAKINAIFQIAEIVYQQQYNALIVMMVMELIALIEPV